MVSEASQDHSWLILRTVANFSGLSIPTARALRINQVEIEILPYEKFHANFFLRHDCIIAEAEYAVVVVFINWASF